MKKNAGFHAINKRKMLLAIAASVLVIVMAVGTTVGWIEEVSHVEFNSENGQVTPLHVGDKILKSDAVIKDNPQNNSSHTISLKEYFYESGDMHLSPCYGDGDNFYFPVEGDSTSVRTGTKDDANVNYLSATFRLRSEGADTVYWFQQASSETPYVTFKSGDNPAVENSTLSGALRCSITVDGSTNVYAFNSNGEYKIWNPSPDVVGDSNVEPQSGRPVDKYSYYQEQYNEDGSPDTATNSSFANQGDGGNLNGNTLFSINKYDSQQKTGVKIITVKLWLEYGAGVVNDVNLSDINIQIVSSWDKVRRIYVEDKTVDEIDNGSATGTHWLTTQNSPTLFWMLTNNTDKYWPKANTTCTSVGYVDNSPLKQYFDIPAVYNNVEASLLRCSDQGWNTGNEHDGLRYWDKYDTTFPNTFHSETYTVYSKTFATWNSDDVSAVYFVNSGSFDSPKAYMWDSASVHGTGINDKVVKNANWPGVDLTKLNADSGKGWPFDAASGQSDKLCTLDTQGNSGYYTFRLSKASTNVLYLSVKYSSSAPTASYSEDSDYQLHINDGSNYTFKKISDTSFILTQQYNANQSITFNIKKNNDYFGNTGTISTTNINSQSSFPLDTFFYTSDYDRIIFSDGVADGENKEYQTQDLKVKDISQDPPRDWSNKTFDMSTLTWFDADPTDTANLPYYSHNNTYLYSNIVSGDRWVQTRFAYGGQYGSTSGNAFNNTTENNMLCKIYNKTKTTSETSNYECLVYINGVKYGANKNENKNLTAGNTFTLKQGSDKMNITLYQLNGKTVYRVYLQNENGTYKLHLAKGAADTTDSTYN